MRSISTTLRGMLGCLLLASMQVAANNKGDLEYRYVSFDDIAAPKKIGLSQDQRKLIDSFVLSQYGKYFKYKTLGVYSVNTRYIYVKLYLVLKGGHFSEWRKLQSERVRSGERRQPSMTYDFAVIDLEESKVFPLGVDYIVEDGALRFHFGSCLNDRFAFESDINLDGEKELFFIRGYEPGTDAYSAIFNHYKLYLFSGYDTLLFDEWLVNVDHDNRSLNTLRRPKITGMAGTKFSSNYTIKYDGYDAFREADSSGLKRFNSQFYFDYIDKERKGISKQLVLVWSQIYRPSPDPKIRDFVMIEQRFKWYEGDVSKKTGFVEKPVTEKDFRAFLSNYKLSFDDGLTGRRLCEVKLGNTGAPSQGKWRNE